MFKIVTAAAAIDHAGLHPTTVLKFNGGNYTLYKRNVLSDTVNRWTRSVTLREAFARSFNTPFGRIGIEALSPEVINDYASRFMFNQTIPSDIPVEMGVTT
ncbi:MAG: penicillin-binding transpeptidase domain-containing protein, partial [Bdellovibrionaceae bacterium]|nr:penicillin-binding transpeptidase domain-containing protein [Pseudobdellovibrionaceae bacterium]